MAKTPAQAAANKPGRAAKTDAEKAEAKAKRDAAIAARKASLEAMSDDEKKAFRATEKASNFTKLARKRMTVALAKIKIVGNLANTNQYAYTAEQSAKIVNTLEDAVKAVKNAFAVKGPDTQTGFDF